MADVQSVALVGAGFMGSGIAEAVARSGLGIRVHEPVPEMLDRSRTRIAASLEKAESGGKLEEAAAAVAARIEYADSLEALAPADLVIEAIVEDVDVKRRVFADLDRLMPEHTLLATNTSSIPVSAIAAATGRADRVLGIHFFSPAAVMRLVEVVRALETSDAAVEAGLAFARRIGKEPIEAKDRSGFVVNALLVPYLAAAIRMYEEGFATAEAIDTGMRLGCGHPMGPLTLSDFIGLDVTLAVLESLYDEFRAPHYAPPPILRRMVESGRLGKKSGRGFYDYG